MAKPKEEKVKARVIVRYYTEDQQDSINNYRVEVEVNSVPLLLDYRSFGSWGKFYGCMAKTDAIAIAERIARGLNTTIELRLEKEPSPETFKLEPEES